MGTEYPLNVSDGLALPTLTCLGRGKLYKIVWSLVYVNYYTQHIEEYCRAKQE